MREREGGVRLNRRTGHSGGRLGELLGFLNGLSSGHWSAAGSLESFGVGGTRSASSAVLVDVDAELDGFNQLVSDPVTGSGLSGDC